MQGYFRIRQTAADLRKKKGERESRRRDRETAEKPLENDGKFKVEEMVMEDSKDSDKVLDASGLEKNDLLLLVLHHSVVSCGCGFDTYERKFELLYVGLFSLLVLYWLYYEPPTHCRQILNVDMFYVQNGSRPEERERHRRDRRYSFASSL